MSSESAGTTSGTSDSGTSTSTAIIATPASISTAGDAGSFILDIVITESDRLDLAFARALDATLARRYAESARL